MENIANKILNICDKHDIEYKVRNGQASFKYCPFCQGGDHSDEYTFFISLETGAFYCHRGSCEVKGNFNRFCDFFGEKPDTEYNFTFNQKNKIYKHPSEDDIKPLTDDIITYFAMRRISEDTLKAFKIGSDEKGNIVFPLYRDNKLLGAKYRKPQRRTKDNKDPKEWGFRDMEPILFGMDNISFNKPLYITEGQIDALSLYEAGIHNVVSVSMGCNNFDFIELCWDWLENFSEIVMFGDQDECGTAMCSMLAKRLGEDRCMFAPIYPAKIKDGKDFGVNCKDANEILLCYGPDKLYEIANSCQPVPVKGIINLAEVQFINPSTIPRIYTRIPQLDNAIAGLAEGSVTVFTGKRGEGKSTINGQLLLNAIQQGKKVCAYSGELSAEKFLEWIMLQATEEKYIGVETDTRTGKKFATVSTEIQTNIRKWIDGKFFLFDNANVDDAAQNEAILKVFTICARRYGCKVFLADNLMSALTSADEETKAQAKFAAALKAFAVKYKVAVILVAHPRKTKAGETLTNDDVSGSSAITNLADNVIAVEKPNLRITKNREFGICEFIQCNYNPANRRIYQANVGDRTVYGWNHEGIDIPEEQACKLDEFQIQSGVSDGDF